VLLLAAPIGFVETLLFTVLAPLLPAFEQDLGLSKAGAGLLTSGYALGAFAGALPSVWVARRIGVKRTALLGLLVLAASSLACAFPDTSEVVFAARFGQGVGSAFAYTGALAWLTAVAPTARRAEAIGIVFVIAFTGALFGPLLGAVAERAGAAPVFIAVAGLSLLLAAVAAVVPSPPADVVPTGPLRSLAGEATVRIGVWLVGLVGLLLGCSACSARCDSTSWGGARSRSA
jgi:MFS family permease